MANAQQVGFLIAGLLDDDGNPLAGGKVYTYAAGTTTDQATYTDAAKTTPATNPIILDSLGRATIYAEGNYKFKIDTADDVNVNTIDNLYFGVPSTVLGVVQLKTSDYTVAATDDYVLVNASSGNVVISLMSAATVDGKKILVEKTDSSANTVTVDPSGAETIEGAATYVLTSQYQGVQVISDGTNWVSNVAIVDEDDMASDAVNKTPTQQSVKAYVASYTASAISSASLARVGTNAARLALTPSAVGLRFYENDTGRWYYCNAISPSITWVRGVQFVEDDRQDHATRVALAPNNAFEAAVAGATGTVKLVDIYASNTNATTDKVGQLSGDNGSTAHVAFNLPYQTGTYSLGSLVLDNDSSDLAVKSVADASVAFWCHVKTNPPGVRRLSGISAGSAFFAAPISSSLATVHTASGAEKVTLYAGRVPSSTDAQWIGVYGVTTVGADSKINSIEVAADGAPVTLGEFVLNDGETLKIGAQAASKFVVWGYAERAEA